MQYLDDDMSELFRKASEDIRLRPEDDDWDNIQKRLLPDISLFPIAQTPIIKRNNYRLWVFVFTFLAISGAVAIHLMNETAAWIDIEHIPGSNRVVKSERKSANENSLVIHRPNTNRLLTSSESLELKEFSILYDAEQKDAEPMYNHITEQLEKIGVPLKLDLFKNVESTKNQKSILKGKRFYVGIIAGPQLSQTKQQEFSSAGLSAGLLAGFHLNTKLAIESGFILSNKQYSSAGEYFDMSKLSATMPSGMKLIHVQSKINVLEIPINIKYDVIKINKGDLFVSGGITSYILTSEKNQYQASLNGNNETMAGNYSRNQNYFAAAINVSAGYECRAGKNINLRIEPYFQIPMKTIGMGSMHVVSTGVYLGITIPIIK